MRHDLGEYYTPDWLAEHVLNELGYEGDPDKRLLDPACGSGTFLVMAISRIRRWYDLNREKCAYDEGELLKKILGNVIGFDLNPLAVMAARTNYLVAIKDLVRYVDNVEIPVYLCDSIMTPAEYGDLFTGAGTVAKVPCGAMKPPHLLVPKEIAKSPKEVATYAGVLEVCVRNGYSPHEFLSRCREEGLSITTGDDHIGLYKELVRLDKENKNGIWARIIKNNFAPLFVGRVDYVAGNPPWVNWESLPGEYRDSMKPLWQSYGLFSLSGSAGRLGGGKKDISMLFVYTCVDQYLRNAGKLGFVITQTVFKTKGAGDGFRQLRFERDKKRVVLKPLVVHDLSEMQVFEGATNSTAVFICEKIRRDFAYPVPYIQWSGPSRIEQDEALSQVIRDTVRQEVAAVPVDRQRPSSPWLSAPARVLAGIEKLMRPSDYKAYAGACTWLNGAYWARVIKRLTNGDLLIENLFDVGKIKVDHVQMVIEPDLLYPLLRGRDVSRWRASPSAYIVLAQDPETRAGVPEATMKRGYPKTYSYFKKFEGILRKRSGYRQYFQPDDPFWSIYNVGSYSLAPIRVFWRQFIPELRMALHKPAQDQFLGTKVSLTQHVVSFVPFETEEEAMFFAGCGNSSAATLLHWRSSTAKSYGQPHILGIIAIPRYNPKDKTQRRISQLAARCHKAAARSDTEEVTALEGEIDRVAANLWGIKEEELQAIQETLAEIHKPRRMRNEEAEEES